VGSLRLDIALPLRAFPLELALEADAETVALVGPSGAGKTTVLRAVAGLAKPARGRIVCGDETWFDAEARIDLRPEGRPVGFVFQEYALFPHLSVRANVAYGGPARADELLERFGLARLASVRPTELSGGERQRVALARALARDPQVVLLDEPLAALDAHTKREVRAELHELLQELHLPTLLVTHDFEDASLLADRIAVLAEGKLLQLGRPEEFLATPRDTFVASLTGANLLYGVARPSDDGLTEVTLRSGERVYSTDAAEGEVGVAVYPWEVAIGLRPEPDSTLNHLRGEIRSLAPLGNRVRVLVGPLTAEITLASAERLGLEEGQQALASFKATGTRIVPLAGVGGSGEDVR
jgi:molybdate transport system ATP-binding protein